MHTFSTTQEFKQFVYDVATGGWSLFIFHPSIRFCLPWGSPRPYFKIFNLILFQEEWLKQARIRLTASSVESKNGSYEQNWGSPLVNCNIARPNVGPLVWLREWSLKNLIAIFVIVGWFIFLAFPADKQLFRWYHNWQLSPHNFVSIIHFCLPRDCTFPLFGPIQSVSLALNYVDYLEIMAGKAL